MHLDKKLPFNIRAVVAMRFDRHDNFGSFYSPKFALVKGVGRGNFRITWGKGYAMPSIQNQYAGIGRILFGNGGTGIYYIPNLANVRDTSAFLTTTALKPEQVSTLEIGYKGTVLKNLFIDINYYNGISKNYISPSRTVAGRIISINGIKVVPAIPGTIVNDTLRNASFSTFFNYGEVRAYGLDVGISYTFSKFLSLAARYSWFGSDISKNNLKNDANKDGYVSLEERSLNAPTHRGNLILNLDNLHKEKLSLSISARFVESYDFYSASQIGTASGKGKRGVVERPGQPPIRKNFDWGPLGGFTTIDLRGSYKLNEMVRFNLGITNLLDTDQVEFVASPSIGRLYMAEVKLSIPQLSKKL